MDRRDTRVRRAAASLAAVANASVYARACPPHEWTLAAWVVPGLFLAAVERLRPGRAAACGALFAVLFGWGMTGWAVHASLEGRTPYGRYGDAWVPALGLAPLAATLARAREDRT